MTPQFLGANAVVPQHPCAPAITPARTKLRKGIKSFATVAPHHHYAEQDAASWYLKSGVQSPDAHRSLRQSHSPTCSTHKCFFFFSTMLDSIRLVLVHAPLPRTYESCSVLILTVSSHISQPARSAHTLQWQHACSKAQAIKTSHPEMV